MLPGWKAHTLCRAQGWPSRLPHTQQAAFWATTTAWNRSPGASALCPCLLLALPGDLFPKRHLGPPEGDSFDPELSVPFLGLLDTLSHHPALVQASVGKELRLAETPFCLPPIPRPLQTAQGSLHPSKA